ncbi:MAG: hypothetical protein Q8868_13605 [Bacteroidota bacterium]|nr:hypothetical protein [Bacteroidota bacterium]
MKRVLIVFILIFIILPNGNFSFCQDILYKKDSSAVKVKILDFNGRTVIYKIPGDTTGRTFYLSKILLDSLKYSDGKALRFQQTSDLKGSNQKMLNRNYLRVELVDLLTGLVNLDYERLSKTGSTGLVAGLCINFSSGNNVYWESYHDILQYSTYRPFYFFVRTGVDFYPFNYSLEKTSVVRTSTGIHVLTGSVKKANYDVYTENGPLTGPSFLIVVSWDISERFYLGNNFQIRTGLEMSIIPFLTFFHPQLSVCLSF